jgi:translocation and assembly module TamA
MTLGLSLSAQLPRIGLALALLAIGAGLRAEIELSGVDEIVAANVRAFLTIDEEGCDADQSTVRRHFAAAPAQIQSALEAFGYYAPAVDSSLELGESCWTAVFRIEPGERVLIRSVDVRIDGAASTDAAFATAQSNSALRAGEPLRHAQYEGLKQQFQNLARDRGYASARFTANRIDIYPLELVADVTLHFESGDRYRFGEVVVEQNVLREDFVATFIQIKPGDPYDNALLTSTYVALNDSGYFDVIDVRPQPPDNESRTIDVTMVLGGVPRRLINYGVGFSTDTGPRFRFGRNIRRWNERGHQLAVNALLSPVVSEVTAIYRYPVGDPRYEWVSFDGGIKRENTDTAESETLAFGARRVVERPSGWSRTQLMSLLLEDFEVAGQEGRSRLLMPEHDWSRLRTDSAVRPSQGSKTDFELRGAGDALGSDTSFIQAVASTKWITSLSNRARVIARARLGVTWEDEFEDLPPSVRFFAGGDTSIRGYEFESLGPMDAAGQVIGGSRLAVASVEYEHPIRQRWSFAVFVDSGNAFTNGDFDAKTGAGIGARWLSPLGPIRLDIGFPINDPEHGARIHVSLGPDL